MMIWSGRQRIRYTETLAITRAASNEEAKEVNEAWDMYGDALYPYRKSQEAKKKQEQVDILHRWVSQGPVLVTPEQETRHAARQRKLLQKGQAVLSEREKALQQGEIVRISSKLWRERTGAKPMAVGKAKRRDT